MAVSEARRAANRANAQRSTGPRTAAGRQAVRFNALKHGLAGRTAVLDEAEAAGFAALRAELAALHRPAGALEEEALSAIAEELWRMRRGAAVEALVLRSLIDKDEAGELEADEVIALPQHLLRIGRYESRIERGYERALLRLRQLQEARAASPSPDRSGGAGTVAEGGVSPKPGRGPSRSDGKGEGQGAARSRSPSFAPRPDPHPAPLPQSGRGRKSQFSAEDGFVSSRIEGPPSWSAAARLRAGCAGAALLGPPGPADWDFAPALRGATLRLAREDLPRAA